MKSGKSSSIKIILIAVILLGAFFRFYKLDWGQGLFTHPDEYHIVISVNQLSFPNQMHPHFFNYGTVIIYLIYLTKLLIETSTSFISSLQPVTLSPFLLGRFYSALFSTLTILLVFKISQYFLNERFALIAALFTALTPGLIQQAHFATPESALIFFLFGMLLFSLKFIRTQKTRPLVLAAVFLGLGLGVKVSGIVFALPLFLAIVLNSWPSILKIVRLFTPSLLITLATFAIVAPFVFLDFSAFWGSFEYESGLARGLIPVFYTRQFFDTTPFLFQIEKIFPFALGPALLITGLMGFGLILYFILKSYLLNLKSTETAYYIILTAAFLSLFIPNSLLFAKWTRFIAPTFPFFAIFASFLLSKFSQSLNSKSLSLIFNSLFFILAALWAFNFFSIYASPDIRLTASQWLESNTSVNSIFLVEGGNMVDLPLNGNHQHISLDFYKLEEDKQTQQQVINALANADYFLIQSRRVFYNHQRLTVLYPKTNRFYNALFDGSLGFTQVKQFTSFPRLSLLGQEVEFPDETAEETWSVFDHPVIRVFKKTRQLSYPEYVKLVEG